MAKRSNASKRLSGDYLAKYEKWFGVVADVIDSLVQEPDKLKAIGVDPYHLPPPEVATAVLMRESSGNPGVIGDGGRAVGLFQVHEPAAIDVGVPYEAVKTDPRANIAAGVLYLAKQIKRTGDPRLALAAYNRGAAKILGALRAARGDSDAAFNSLLKDKYARHGHSYATDVLEAANIAAKKIRPMVTLDEEAKRAGRYIFKDQS